VLGNITVLAGNRVVVFTPAATLAASTSYRVSLNHRNPRHLRTATCRGFHLDVYNRRHGNVISNRLRPEQIVIGYPDANSVSNITIPAQQRAGWFIASRSSTRPAARRSRQSPELAQSTLQIQARVGDEITLTITQPDGTQYGVTQAAYRPPMVSFPSDRTAARSPATTVKCC
jgi:hypothetical protein